MKASSSPSAASPAEWHPWNLPLKPDEEDRLRAELLVPLATGLIASGAVFRHVRQGRPFRQSGHYHFDLDGVECALRLEGYGGLRWVWRITVGTPSHPRALCNHQELTFASEEMNEPMGRDLAAMLRALTRDEKPVWPLFDHDPSFPRYAWSQLCETRYEDWRRWREAVLAHDAQKPARQRAAA